MKTPSRIQTAERWQIVETQQSPEFPPAWRWFFDEALTGWVKNHYSPRDSWKGKPFGKEDAHFFFRGIEELSELFTEERGRKINDYLLHPRFRSAYLLYFLPMQAAKFVALFDQHPAAMKSLIKHGKEQGAIRICDLGAGPATASLAFLFWALKQKEELPPIEILITDLNADILKDGAGLCNLLASHFPKLRDKVKVFTEAAPWWKTIEHLEQSCSLTIMGNVLNEALLPPVLRDYESAAWNKLWKRVLELNLGAGVLIVDPASRISSQKLSQLRNLFFDKDLLPRQPTSLHGPCLHAETCPLSEGRDWCHFSVQAKIPGAWFLRFSKGLGSERHWVKFCYLWVSGDRTEYAETKLAHEHGSELRRVISDPMDNLPGSTTAKILLCEPNEPRAVRISTRQQILRGDIVRQPRAPSREPAAKGGQK